MNYLRQINEFHLRRKLHPVTGMSISMYFVLLDRFNQARFPEWMPVSTGYLAGEMGVSVTTVRNCRDDLIENGYLNCKVMKKISLFSIVELGDEIQHESLENQPPDNSADLPGNPADA